MQDQTADTALYSRLSKEDKSRGKNLEKGSSDSIESQKMLLEQHAAEHGFRVFDHYSDDGISGTTFQRKDFIRMMEDINAGHIKTVIVKDLSRLGRDYIETGRYQEIVFPEKGVRLIALGDNYDSDDESGTDLAPFRNLFNDFYPKDISKKTRAALNARAHNGEYLGAGLYGYLKRPDDKHRLIPDEETAPIVQRIFSMAANGYGFQKIARAFSNEKIPTPGTVKGGTRRADYHKSTDWNFPTIRAILNNPMYLGCVIHGRTKKLGYKSDIIRPVPEEKWIVVEGTHEPLITQELWDLAHQVIKKRSKPMKTGEPHIFSGLLKCADCGSTMAKDGVNGFSCQRYKVYGKEQCSNHRITMENLSAVVLASIQKISNEIKQNRDSFIARLSSKGKQKEQLALDSFKKERRKLDNRHSEIALLIKKAFEKNALGTLPDDIYKSLIDDYAAEKEDIQRRLNLLDDRIFQMEQETKTVNNFVSLIEKYTDIQELDRDILHTLIEKIVIYQGYSENGNRYQQIDIHYRFVGQI